MPVFCAAKELLTPGQLRECPLVPCHYPSVLQHASTVNGKFSAPASTRLQSSKLAMLSLVLSTSSRNLAHPSIISLRCYHIGKAGSVHTAIQRGLRKSRGAGFRGTERGHLSPDDPREKYRVQHGIPEYQSPPSSDPGSMKRGYQKIEKKEWPGKSSVRRSKWGKRGTSRTPDLRIRLGKRLIAGEEERGWAYAGRPTRSGHAEKGPNYFERPERDSHDSRPSFKDSSRGGFGGKFGGKRGIGGRTSERSGRDSGLPSTRSFGRSTDEHSYGSRSHDRPSESSSDRYPSLSFKRSPESKFGNSSSNDRRPSDGNPSQHEPATSDRSIKYGDRSSFDNTTGPPRKRYEDSSASEPKFTQTADNRIPLSVPYTTPASEFLYGTSVVEAALSSRREQRRKLYKFYIYTGENREDADQDARLERLARKNGVEVVRAGNDFLRVMDKMSAGRPHNGYILEASPLPRLPITSLGRLTTMDGQDGFEVSLDYQSREEAAVNGTSNFIKIPRNRHGRKPLVLLLDSIVDPGNLGGIIRTAYFLGVTAIAISTRNSASFTPVVLKASAGASEDVTLFMVNKPAGFVVDSKAAGWKVFAAVAPAKQQDPAMPASLSTDDLKDPLSQDPCVLMLGGEGEGLRWNLRSKADADLYIEGSWNSRKVDSLNVSVAAGILCNSFLRSTTPEAPPIRQEQDKEVPTANLF